MGRCEGADRFPLTTEPHEASIGYFAQDHRTLIEEGTTAIEWLHQWDPAAVTEELRGVLGQMLFQREEATKSTSVLSGGEAARMLIVEQGQTIESQRALIRELFRDSTELSGVKMKASQQRAQALTQNPSTQTPSSQTPSTQAAPRQQAPSTQLEPQHRADNQVKSGKPHFQIPSKPASDLGDTRRALITI